MMSVIFKSSEETVLKTDMILVTEISGFPVSFGATDLNHSFKEVHGAVCCQEYP